MTARSTSNLGGRGSGRANGFTLIEVLVVVAIIALVSALGSVGWTKMMSSNIEGTAINALVNFASVVRTYAMVNAVECMMVVNPNTGQFELWHANAPEYGGAWDPQSGTQVNGYVFAPVLDETAKLPTTLAGVPKVMVFPGDYATRVGTQPTPVDEVINMTWTAIAFDATGRCVTVQRRIALDVTGDDRTDGQTAGVLPGQLIDQAGSDRRSGGTGAAADPGNPPYTVDDNDTLLTSTTGFVVTSRDAMMAWATATSKGWRDEIGISPVSVWLLPNDVYQNGNPATEWLAATEEGSGTTYEGTAKFILFNRMTGQPVTMLAE